MRQQVDFVEHHERSRRKHVGVFQRFVVALGHRQNDHLGRLAQVPKGGAHKVAHVFNEQQAGRLRGFCAVLGVAGAVLVVVLVLVLVVVAGAVIVAVQLRKSSGDHGRVQVATFAGVDLNHRGTGGADALGVKTGLLVALNHRHGQAGCVRLQGFDGGAQQRRFARTGAGHQVERGHVVGQEVGAVLLRHAVVGPQNVGLQLHRPPLAHARHRHPGRASAKVQVAALARAQRHRIGLARVGLYMPNMGQAVVTASTHHTHARSPLLCSSKHLAKPGAGGYASSPTCISTTRKAMPPVGRSW